MTKNFLLYSTILLSFYSLNLGAHAYDNIPVSKKVIEQGSSKSSLYNNDITVKFSPKSTTHTMIDYEAWDKILDGMIIDTGLSVRRTANRKSALTGTRILAGSGHLSPYRLEGNKVVFSLMDDEYKALINEYQKSLVEIANQIDIKTLPRNEQLAFWFNLHNATTISEIAKVYPVSSPDKIRIGKEKVKLDDAKIISIKDTKLSLKDIRTNIVYRNWKSPDVMYGFFTGTISSPSIQVYAFDSKNITQLLKRSAVEYTNSLRGYRQSGNTRLVSRLYWETAPFYFPNFDEDLSQHLSTHMRPDVYGEYSNGGKLSATNYDGDIADTVKGELFNNRIQAQQLATAEQAFNANTQVGLGGQTFIGGVDNLGAAVVNDRIRATGASNLNAFLRELRVKYRVQRKKGLSGKVIIEDIETVDPDIE